MLSAVSSLSLLVLVLHTTVGRHPFVTAAAPGKIKLYDDYNCDTPSTINPTVTLALSVCLVTTGGEGLIIAELPSCADGEPILIYYQDPACGTSTTNASPSIFASNCMQLAAGTDIYNAKSVMFSCQFAADNPQPTSTSTAVVIRVAAVATGSSDDGGGSSSTSTSSMPTDSVSPVVGTGNTGTKSNSTAAQGTNGSDTKTDSKSGLDTGDIIALAVGLGIGIPTIAIMLLTWLKPRAAPIPKALRYKVEEWKSGSHQRPVGYNNYPGPMMQAGQMRYS